MASSYRLTGLAVDSLSTVYLSFHKLAITLVRAPRLLDLSILPFCRYCAFLYLGDFPSVSELRLWIKKRFYTCV